MLGFPWYSRSQVEVLCLLVEVLLSSSGESTALIEAIACGFVREEKPIGSAGRDGRTGVAILGLPFRNCGSQHVLTPALLRIRRFVEMTVPHLL